MRSSIRLALTACLAIAPAAAQLKSGPPLPHRLVQDWAKLPPGWNFGEFPGVDVDRQDNVWVFNRSPHPVIQFDKNGKMLQAWNEVQVKSPHSVRVDPEGNVWLIDVKGHMIFKFTAAGRLLMVLGRSPGTNDSKEYFNEPTGIAFTPAGDLYISDGYVNSRVIKFNKNGEYLTHWGRRGTGDGEFNLPHDVCLDSRGRVYVADRANQRVQIFDASGKFLGKWTDIGAPWGLYYVAREDAIYMCDGNNNRVVKLDLNGRILGVLGAYGKIPGRFDYAHNIAVDSEGSIYVTEIKNWRIQKFAR